MFSFGLGGAQAGFGHPALRNFQALGAPNSQNSEEAPCESPGPGQRKNWGNRGFSALSPPQRILAKEKEAFLNRCVPKVSVGRGKGKIWAENPLISPMLPLPWEVPRPDLGTLFLGIFSP